MNSDWKDKLSGLLPDDYLPEMGADNNVPPIKKQTLRVELDKRNGKPATIISEFEGTENELKSLAKTLKSRCAAGGSQRSNEILIQGDFRIKIHDILAEMGYKVKKINF